jgi:hypothetical protein
MPLGNVCTTKSDETPVRLVSVRLAEDENEKVAPNADDKGMKTATMQMAKSRIMKTHKSNKIRI